MDNVKYWLDTSLYDFEVANSLYKKKHYLYSVFLCHQSIEKMLKAAYVKKQNKFPPKIHNLIKLTELSELKDILSQEQLIFLAELDPMNIEARYPTYIDNIRKLISKKDAKNTLIKSMELLKWLQSRLY
jgi:HEPN domain-containing protein